MQIPRIGVLALQGDFSEHLAVLERLPAEPVDVRLPSALADLDGLILPGGESTSIARLLDSYGLRAPIQALARDGMPLWGTCAGAILMARRSPGLDRPGLELMDMEVHRNAFGRQVDSFEEDLDFAGLTGPKFHAVFIRAPVIDSIGPAVTALARLGDGTIVAASEGNLMATSFHPELSGDDRIHAGFVSRAHAYKALRVRLRK